MERKKDNEKKRGGNIYQEEEKIQTERDYELIILTRFRESGFCV